MAYRQKVTNPDIRTVTLKDLPMAASESIETAAYDTAVAVRHPGADIRRILFSVVPLIILLLIASYLDMTRQWVVPFAHWLMKLGA